MTEMIKDTIVSESTIFLAQFLSMLLQPVGLLKVIQNLFCAINIQEREPYLGEWMKYAFNIDLRSNTFGPISFKLGMMIDTTALYGLIPV